MEAITAASVCTITIYDMCKSVDKGMVISDIHLVKNQVERVGRLCLMKIRKIVADNLIVETKKIDIILQR